jgi:hypothetical protein
MVVVSPAIQKFHLQFVLSFYLKKAFSCAQAKDGRTEPHNYGGRTVHGSRCASTPILLAVEGCVRATERGSTMAVYAHTAGPHHRAQNSMPVNIYIYIYIYTHTCANLHLGCRILFYTHRPARRDARVIAARPPHPVRLLGDGRVGNMP